ncbi:hypothetical protein P7C71_g3289, partial [Lecanoromycetidae sp. Uapishka_2]
MAETMDILSMPGLTDSDRENLAGGDEKFQPHTWEELKSIIDPSDFKILLNDWPYGISSEITHMIVWSKVPIPDQKPDGYLTPESAALIRDFVQRTFIDRLAAAGVEHPEDCVLWFRNWTGLQSVPGLEHIHICVRNAPHGLLEEWTGSQKSESL